MPNVDILLVGGGGGGKSANSPSGGLARGGGGGELLENFDLPVVVQQYPVTIGVGGARQNNAPGFDGGDTTALGFTARGGKGASTTKGGDSGSGLYFGSFGTNGTGAGDSQNGENGHINFGGDAGRGTNSSMDGTTKEYAGGGNTGGRMTFGIARPNNPGRGCSAGSYGNGDTKANDGVVVIRYITGSLMATGGTITIVGIYTVHTFTSDGVFEVVSFDLYGIKGTVTLSDTPVQNATVRCIRQSDNATLTPQTTGVDGTYIFSRLDSAELYHLCVEYEDQTQKYYTFSYWDIQPVVL